MKNNLLKYCLLLLSFLVVMQTLSADSLQIKIKGQSIFKNAALSMGVVQADVDDSPPMSFGIFHSTILTKQFFKHACYNCNGTLSNPGSQTLDGWVKVKLQV